MLLKSRKFWLLVLDSVISIALLAVGIQWPAQLELVKTVIALLQPIFVALIVAWTIDDTVQAYIAFRMTTLGRMK